MPFYGFTRRVIKDNVAHEERITFMYAYIMYLYILLGNGRILCRLLATLNAADAAAQIELSYLNANYHRLVLRLKDPGFRSHFVFS